jgi:hypothetical protein
MTRICIVLLILISLVACGGSHCRKTGSVSAQPDPGSSGYGGNDPGYSDPDPGSGDYSGDDPGYSDPDPGSDPYGGDDSSYVDPGTGDPNDFSTDGGDSSSDVLGEKASRLMPGSAVPSLTVEATNYDSVPYVLYVEARAPRAKWRKLYLPPVPAARSGGFTTTHRSFRLKPGFDYSLVLENAQGLGLDSRRIVAGNTAGGRAFSIVGATLLDPQG